MRVSPFFDTQRLLFDTTKPVEGGDSSFVSEKFYDRGWQLLSDIHDEDEAVLLTGRFIGSIDATQIPLQKAFGNRIKLAKADHIPVCDDIVSSSFQVLHFDTGHPFVESAHQLLVTHVGIYLPFTTDHKVEARTRLVELTHLLQPIRLSSTEVESKITEYVAKHGDGWADTNSLRLACFARFLDALQKEQELQHERDKTVGQWFQNEDKVDGATALKREYEFYTKCGVDLSKHEQQISLQPGQLLILDNTRVIHGRVGKRRAKELFNFMFGFPEATYEDIQSLRNAICQLVV